jgi:putative transposase
MEERKEVVTRFVAQGLKVDKATSIAGIARSTYYYKSNGRRKGKMPGTSALKNNNSVDNDVLIADIMEMLGHEFNDYGYMRTTMALRNMGYCINKKKVYRIMKEHQLLFPKKKKTPMNKSYVKYTSPLTDYPFQVIEVDIKYIYIIGEKRSAYLITLLDTFARIAPEWILEYDMKAQRVMELIHRFTQYWKILQMPEITIRSDNGSQFIAKAFRNLLQEQQIDHEYIHPGTPQENGHIESFHNTVEKIICKRHEFENIIQAREIFTRFYDFYNNTRIMEAILFQSPINFLKLWAKGKVGIKRDHKTQTFFFREKPGDNTGASLHEDFINFRQNKANDNLIKYITTS